jgi:hypothetical protein
LLSNASAPADYDQVRSQLRDEMTRAPLTVGALRDLAELAELQPGLGDANALMEMAARLTRRDDQTARWLVFHRLAAGDYTQAILQADLLARRDVNIDQWVLFLPQLLPALRTSAGQQAIVQRLSLRPAWRAGFLGDLVADDPDTGSIEAIYERLHAAKSGPEPDEITSLVTRLLGDGRFAEARTIWGDLTGAGSPKGNLIYDGDFAGRSGPPPFNWRLTAKSGVYAETAVAADGASALRAELPTDDSDLLAEQLVVAPAGHYRFSGRVMMEEAIHGGAFEWGAWCSSNNVSLVKASFAAAGPWLPFELDFDVPDSCGTLAIRLQTEGGDGGGQTIAWSNKLSLVKLSTGPAPSVPARVAALPAQ